MPLSTFLAGRPGSKVSVHVAMATVRDVMKEYGPRVFSDLYDLAKLAVGDRRVLLSGAWKDVVSICQEDRRDELIDELSDAHGDELQLVCTELNREAPLWTAAGKTFRDCMECPLMVVVPAGTSAMGAARPDGGSYGCELRQLVRIKTPFAAGVYEVTFSEWGGMRSGRWLWRLSARRLGLGPGQPTCDQR